MSTTPTLALPYLAAGQAQKHVTLNESLRMLDALVQLSLLSRGVAAPPPAPQEGDRYALPLGASGAWAPHAGRIAAFQDGGWTYFTPQRGWLAWIADEAGLFVFDGTGWVAAHGELQNLPLIGVNATADATNRLAVAAPATLLNHEGGGHQLKINKAAPAQTASLLFQTGFSGRAEMGTVGDETFSIKTSADGATWVASLRADPATGVWVGPHLVSTATLSGMPTLEAALGIPGDRFAYFDFHASDSQPDYSSRFIRNPGENGDFEVENIGAGHVRLRASGGMVRVNTAGIDRVAVDGGGHFVPVSDNAYNLGGAGQRFSAVWAANGVIQTSDSRDKTAERPMPAGAAIAVLEAVEPILFRWKAGGQEVEVAQVREEPLNPDNPLSKAHRVVTSRARVRKGARLHAGFRAQDIKAALDAARLDFGVWGLEDPADSASRQWLRPDQLIPLLWAALKETRAELKQLAQDQKP